MLTHHGHYEVLMYACKPLPPIQSTPLADIEVARTFSRLMSTMPRKAGLSKADMLCHGHWPDQVMTHATNFSKCGIVATCTAWKAVQYDHCN